MSVAFFARSGKKVSAPNGTNLRRVVSGNSLASGLTLRSMAAMPAASAVPLNKPAASAVPLTKFVPLLLLLLVGGAMPAFAEGALELPPMQTGEPAAGKRVAVTAPEYAGTEVHHSLYLPPDWSVEKQASGETWPVIVEYTGSHFAASRSTGRSADAALGFGISGGRFIWVVLPCVSEDHSRNEVRWWGDRIATVAYAKVNVPRICEEFGGDPNVVFICGFSRGAIGVNLIGLHDDEIARLWCGFVTHDQYDGMAEWKGTDWGSPLRFYRSSAHRRLGRLDGRPALVMSHGHTASIRNYLAPLTPLGNFTFMEVDVSRIFEHESKYRRVHSHSDRWLLEESPERRRVWKWVDDVRRTCQKGSPGKP